MLSRGLVVADTGSVLASWFWDRRRQVVEPVITLFASWLSFVVESFGIDVVSIVAIWIVGVIVPLSYWMLRRELMVVGVGASSP